MRKQGCSILYSVQNNTLGKTVQRKSDLFSQEKAAHVEQIRAAIGRWLRDQYDTTQPLPKRLADLVRKIEKSVSTDLRPSV
jgi:hypothetical protein